MRRQTSFKLAKSIVEHLQKAGYTAFFAGGWVRDFIMGHPSQDIDIATSAHPEEVMGLFPRSVAVGAQFGVVRVLIRSHEFEVASFRSDMQYVDGRRPVDVHLHSSPEEDAQRRDFTINGLFYDPVHKKVYDFVGGEEDIRRKVIRAIGCPSSRFKEDRLRMVRAIRFKNTLRFTIEKTTWQAICDEAPFVVPAVSPERIWQELTKMKGVLADSLRDMGRSNLLGAIFPPLKQCSDAEIERRIAAIEQYSGSSLIGAVCLLFQGDQSPFLGEIVETFHLSKKEGKVVELFRTFGMFRRRLSQPLFARLYALPEWEDYAAAVATARKNPKEFLRKHKKAAKELSFWVKQIRANSYVVTGQDLEKIGICPGPEMGNRIRQAFRISVTLRLKNKEKILKALLDETPF